MRLGFVICDTSHTANADGLSSVVVLTKGSDHRRGEPFGTSILVPPQF
jgi:hypothetical protein